MPSRINEDQSQWFRDARFGVMFTWGILSMYPLGRYYWYLPYDEYRHLADKFKPKKGWAKRWMDLVKKGRRPIHRPDDKK